MIETKTDLKTESFAVFETSPVLWPKSEKAHAQLPLLNQSVYQSPCSVFRHSWIPTHGLCSKIHLDHLLNLTLSQPGIP